MNVLAWSVAFGLLAAPRPCMSATVTGKVNRPSVVWISQTRLQPTVEVEMRNRDRQFIPAVLTVPLGSSVRFPNDDPYFHSIYSVSKGDPFDIGYYGYGPGKLVRFNESAVVDVRCHIHPKMHGVIIVTDGPTTGGVVNSFSLNDVTPGTHLLHVWNDSGERSVSIMVAPRRPTIDLGQI